jgi:hypothetical protein
MAALSGASRVDEQGGRSRFGGYGAARVMLTAQNIHGTYAIAYNALDQMAAEQEPFELVLTMSYDSELTSAST